MGNSLTRGKYNLQLKTHTHTVVIIHCLVGTPSLIQLSSIYQRTSTAVTLHCDTSTMFGT